MGGLINFLPPQKGALLERVGLIANIVSTPFGRLFNGIWFRVVPTRPLSLDPF